MGMNVKLIIGFEKSPKTIIQKLINLWTKGKYFHCEIAFEGSSSVIYNYVSTPEDGLIKEEFKGKKENFDYIEISSTISNNSLLIIEEYIKEQLYTNYDYKGIFLSQIFKVGINEQEKWFCSEFVVKIMQLFLVKKVLDLVPNKVSPNDLFKVLTQ
jgi:hypothetical protein